MKKKNIPALDYGTKYIGLAYWNERSGMTMPIGTLYNDKSLLFDLWSILERYFIWVVVVWYPKQHSYLQNKIDGLIDQLWYINTNLDIKRVNEEYTSVQAAATLWTSEKSLAEDTVAAMHILDYYLETSKSVHQW